MKLRYRVKCHMNITAHCVYTNTLITDWSLFKSFSVIPRTDLQFELFTGSNTKLCCRGVVPLKLMNGMWTLQLPGIIMWICATQPLKPLPGAFAEQEWDETEIIATAIKCIQLLQLQCWSWSDDLILYLQYIRTHRATGLTRYVPLFE